MFHASNRTLEIDAKDPTLETEGRSCEGKTESVLISDPIRGRVYQ